MVSDAFYSRPADGYHPVETTLPLTQAFIYTGGNSIHKKINFGLFEMDILWIYILVAVIVITSVVVGIICCCTGGAPEDGEKDDKDKEKDMNDMMDEENKMMMGEEGDMQGMEPPAEDGMWKEKQKDNSALDKNKVDRTCLIFK